MLWSDEFTFQIVFLENAACFVLWSTTENYHPDPVRDQNNVKIQCQPALISISRLRTIAMQPMEIYVKQQVVFLQFILSVFI